MALHVMEEANHCLGCKVPRCQKGCPIHTNIPEVIRLLKEGKLNEAGWMLFENNPLTTVCSLVCNHEKQCEGNCVRGIKGSPVHFSVIEDYISTTYANQMVAGPKESNGRSVAIVGAGPAGLTIAIILARYGYSVTIFDSRAFCATLFPASAFRTLFWMILHTVICNSRESASAPTQRSALRSRSMISSVTVIRASSWVPGSGDPASWQSRARALAM